MNIENTEVYKILNGSYPSTFSLIILMIIIFALGVAVYVLFKEARE